jgi:hypothetical protein
MISWLTSVGGVALNTTNCVTNTVTDGVECIVKVYSTTKDKYDSAVDMAERFNKSMDIINNAYKDLNDTWYPKQEKQLAEKELEEEIKKFKFIEEYHDNEFEDPMTEEQSKKYDRDVKNIIGEFESNMLKDTNPSDKNWIVVLK